jgi:hypothetical protein
MASTYSNLKIQLMATGENSGTWGNVTNDNLGVAIEQALVETATVTFASANVTLTLTNTNASQTARALRLDLTGTTGGARDLIVPAIQKPYIVNNGTADTITVKVTGQTGVAVPAGRSYLLYNNGTDVVNGLEGISVVSGGTGLETLTAESVVIGNGTNAVKFVAPGSSSNVLTSNGTAWLSQAAATTTNASALTTGTTAVNVGGTGQTTYTDGQLLIGNTTGNTLAKNTLTAGTGIGITNGSGAITINCNIVGGGGFSGSQGFTSPGTFSAPPTTSKVYVMLQAGGGGGGNVGPGGGDGSQGGGGGGGGAAFGVVTVTGGSNYSVTVGSGGNRGGSGGSSSFSNLISANGGSPGGTGPAGSGQPGAGGGGGNGVSPTGIGIAGQQGYTGAGNGGNSIFGTGGQPNQPLSGRGGGGIGAPYPNPTSPVSIGSAGFVFVAF